MQEAADYKSLKNTTTEITFDGRPWYLIRYLDKVVVRDDSYEVAFKAGVTVEVEI